MKRRIWAAMMAAALAVTGLAGCGGSTEQKNEEKETAKAEVPAEPFGDTIKYDPSVEINDGKDISVELWEWGSDDLFQKVIDGYTAIHPNVSIKLVNNPWEDYNDVTALVLASDYEGFPLVAIEALARGIPVISPPVDGVNENVVPGVNGFFYGQGDSSELAMVLDALADGILPDVMPKNCVKSVGMYEKEKVLTGIFDVIESLIDS